jgi:hypothetical protein
MAANPTANYTRDGVVLGLSAGGAFDKKLQLSGLDVGDPAKRAFAFSQWTDGATQADVRLTGVADPQLANEAATLGVVTPLHAFVRVKAVSTGDVSLTSPPAQIDGVTLLAGDRVLLVAQSNKIQNGYYSFINDALERVHRYDLEYFMAGKFFACFQGTVNANTCWVCTNAGDSAIEIDELTFGHFAIAT